MLCRFSFDFVSAEDRAKVIERHRRRLAGEPIPSQYEANLLHADRVTRIPVLISIGIIREGPWSGAAVATIKDLSAIRRTMAELERQRTEIEQILEGLPDTYYRTDAEGKVPRAIA